MALHALRRAEIVLGEEKESRSSTRNHADHNISIVRHEHQHEEEAEPDEGGVKKRAVEMLFPGQPDTVIARSATTDYRGLFLWAFLPA